jgi:hypothetical protein
MCSPSGPPSPGAEPPSVPERFEREMGCSEAEWLRWLPGAVEGGAITLAASSAEAVVGEGRLHITWSLLPPRQLGLVRLLRLLVCFRFDDVMPCQREAFMRRFDLHTQRGGG